MRSEAKDAIEIRGLTLRTWIGVPDQERAAPQELRVHVRITPRLAFEAMADELAATVDYAELAERIRELAAARPRRLIETLAADLAALVLSHPVCQAVEISLEKFILPQTDCVAVHLRRERAGAV